MRQIVGFLLLLAPFTLNAQKGIGIGIHAGFNFADVTNASAVNASSLAGYHFAVFLAPHSRILGSRTELIYSRSGYNYASDTANGSVNLDYIMLAQYMAIHITKYFEIDLGGQTGYLLNAKVDSSKMMSTGNSQLNSIMSYYNRFDYGFGAGVEVHPFMGILIGARYNISLSNLYKSAFNFNSTSQQPPSFIPSSSSINLKNNIIQLFVGYRF